MEEDYHRPAETTLPRQGEEPDPEEHVPQVEEQVRTHQGEGGEPSRKFILRVYPDSLQHQVVDHQRNQQTAKVDPVATAQNGAEAGKERQPLVISGSHEFERVYKDFAELDSRPAISELAALTRKNPPAILQMSVRTAWRFTGRAPTAGRGA